MDVEAWKDFQTACTSCYRLPLERRPANALCVEIGSPLDRCLLQPPDGRGVTRDGGTLDWLRSGGSALAYGVCCLASCPEVSSEDGHGVPSLPAGMTS